MLKKTLQLPHRKIAKGFSLLEMAVVLLIVSLLLGGLMVSLSQTQEMNNRTDAELKLEELLAALYGFAQARGRLPCPATAISTGLEAPVGGSTAITPCTQQHGFIPAATLGLSGSTNANGLLTDSWLGAFRYSVSTANNNAFTSPNGMRTATMALLTPNLRVCTAAACGTVIVSNVPVVLISLGADWVTFTGANVDETENSGEVTINGFRHGNDNDFVSTGYIEDTYDDLITWISPNVLYTRLIAAGQLP